LIGKLLGAAILFNFQLDGVDEFLDFDHNVDFIIKGQAGSILGGFEKSILRLTFFFLSPRYQH